MAVKYYLHDAAPAEAWSAGGNLILARYYVAGFGTSSAAVAAGGKIAPTSDSTASSEDYNGSTWSNSGHTINGWNEGTQGCGISTAGMIVGGGRPGVGNLDETQEYDGYTWTMGGTLSVAKAFVCAGGTQTAGFCAGGWMDFDGWLVLAAIVDNLTDK